jgi:predicted aldo/keto reductase-like oxidoreductase
MAGRFSRRLAPRRLPIDRGTCLRAKLRGMLYRRFGRTNLAMPLFSLGGMRYQQSWERGAKVSEDSQRNVEVTVDRALSLGINHIETARGYGTSEAQLGPALARHRRGAFLLQTKLRPHEDPAQFEQQLEQAFQLLRVETIDLFAFHGLNDEASFEWTLRSGGCWEVAERFHQKGRIKFLGFSTHAPTPQIVRAIESGRFDYVNLHYYYLFQDNHPALVAATAQDMGVFIISPSDKGGRLERPSQRLRALCAPLSPMVFNDLWCLAHPEIHTLSVGAARPSDLDDHLTVLRLLNDPAAVLGPIVSRLEFAYAKALGDRYARHWSEGLRDFREMPGRINVRRILWLRNLVVAYDLLDFAQERYMAMSLDDIWVPGARAENFRDEDMVAALPDSPFRDQIPALLREAHGRLYNPAVKPQP